MSEVPLAPIPNRRLSLSAELVHCHQQSVWRYLRVLGCPPEEAGSGAGDVPRAHARPGKGRRTGGAAGLVALRDEDLVMLYGMTQLKHLYLASSQVTEAGRERLHAALPQCSISREFW